MKALEEEQIYANKESDKYHITKKALEVCVSCNYTTPCIRNVIGKIIDKKENK